MKTANKSRRANGEGESKRECYYKKQRGYTGRWGIDALSSKRNLKRLHTMKDARIRWGVGWVYKNGKGVG